MQKIPEWKIKGVIRAIEAKELRMSEIAQEFGLTIAFVSKLKTKLDKEKRINEKEKKDEIIHFVNCSPTKDDFLIIKKSLFHSLGINNTILISALLSEQEYPENEVEIEDGWVFSPSRDKSTLTKEELSLIKDGWISMSEKDREEDTGLSPKQQRKCIKELVELGIIQVMRKGLPPKQWFKVNYNKF